MESNRSDGRSIANIYYIYIYETECALQYKHIYFCLCLWPYGSECIRNGQKMSGKWQRTNHVRTKSTTRNLLYNDYHRNQRVKSSSLVLFLLFLLLFCSVLCAMRLHLPEHTKFSLKTIRMSAQTSKRHYNTTTTTTTKPTS